MFVLLQEHKYQLSEIEGMMPFERDIYLNMLEAWVKKEEERLQKGA